MKVKEYGLKITELCVACLDDPDCTGTDAAVLIGSLQMNIYEICKSASVTGTDL